MTGCAQRLSLWARDLDGGDAEVEGRVLDDLGRTVTSFATDRYGHTLIEVPYAEGRSYRLAVDRPAVAQAFALPGDTGHAASLRLERTEKGGLRVAVRVRQGETLKGLEAHLGDQTSFTSREAVKKGSAHFPEPRARAPRFVYVVAGKRLLLKAPILIGKEDPYQVRVSLAKDAQPLPGRQVTLQVQTTWLGQPISTDVALSVGHPGLSPRLTSFMARALLQPLVHRGLVLGGSDLVEGREASPERGAGDRGPGPPRAGRRADQAPPRGLGRAPQEGALPPRQVPSLPLRGSVPPPPP